MSIVAWRAGGGLARDRTRAGYGPVPGRSRAGLESVPGRSRASNRRFWVGLGPIPGRSREKTSNSGRVSAQRAVRDMTSLKSCVSFIFRVLRTPHCTWHAALARAGNVFDQHALREPKSLWAGFASRECGSLHSWEIALLFPGVFPRMRA